MPTSPVSSLDPFADDFLAAPYPFYAELREAPIRTVVKAPLSDVKTGSFVVGITAMPEPDGTQKAVEIHIFPEAMRGTGEGRRSWDLMPTSTMTNATVTTQVASNNGNTLVLSLTSALGQKRTSQPVRPMSALPPKAEITERDPHVRLVSKADHCRLTAYGRFSAAIRGRVFAAQVAGLIYGYPEVIGGTMVARQVFDKLPALPPAITCDTDPIHKAVEDSTERKRSKCSECRAHLCLRIARHVKLPS